MIKFFLVCYKSNLTTNMIVAKVLKNLIRIFIYSNESYIKVFGLESCQIEGLIRDKSPVEKKLAYQKFVQDFDDETDSDLIQFHRAHSHVLQHKFLVKMIDHYEEDPEKFLEWLVAQRDTYEPEFIWNQKHLEEVI